MTTRRPHHASLRIALLAVLIATTPALAGPPADAPAGPEGPHVAAAPVAGDVAPEVAFRDARFGWQRLSALCGGGGALLVFEPSDDEMVALQRASAALAAGGIEPVAVRRASGAANWKAIERLGLRYSLLSDPRGVVGAAYGVDAATAGATRWFVVDRGARIAAAGHGGVAEPGFAARVAAALPGAPVPLAAGDRAR